MDKKPEIVPFDQPDITQVEIASPTTFTIKKIVLLSAGAVVILGGIVAGIWWGVAKKKSKTQLSEVRTAQSASVLMNDNETMVRKMNMDKDELMRMTDEELGDMGFHFRESVVALASSDAASPPKQMRDVTSPTSQPPSQGQVQGSQASQPPQETQPASAPAPTQEPSPSPAPVAPSQPPPSQTTASTEPEAPTTEAAGAAPTTEEPAPVVRRELPAPDPEPEPDPEPVQAQQEESPFTITRNISAEPRTAVPSSGDVVLFDFDIEPRGEYIDFDSALFYLTTAIPLTAGSPEDAALQTQPEFHLERNTGGGTWLRIGTASYRQYDSAANFRSIYYELDFGERLRGTARYRLIASNIPCAIAGNSLDISFLDSRGQINGIFRTPDGNLATNDGEYSEVANPVQLQSCPTNQAPITITRQTEQEARTATPEDAQTVLMQFTLDTALDTLRFGGVNMILYFNNTLDQQTIDAMAEGPQYELQRMTNGTWTRIGGIIGNTYNRRGWYAISTNISPEDPIQGPAQYRMVVSSLPCSLAGNTLRASFESPLSSDTPYLMTLINGSDFITSGDDISYAGDTGVATVMNSCAAPDPYIHVTSPDITRTASLDSNEIVLTEFSIRKDITDPIDLSNILTHLRIDNLSLSDASLRTMKQDARFRLQRKANGVWQTILTEPSQTQQSNYEFGISQGEGAGVIIFEPDPRDRIEADVTEYRIAASNLPCELAGQSIFTSVATFDSAVTLRPLVGFRLPLGPAIDARLTSYIGPLNSETRLTACTPQIISLPPPSNAMMWLGLDESSGALQDSSGNGHVSTVAENLQYAQAGKQGRAIRFQSGSPSYAEFFRQGTLKATDPVSIEFYVQPEQSNAWQGLVSKGNGFNQYDYHVALTPRNTIGFYTDEGGVWYEGQRTIDKGKWTHVVVTLGGCSDDGTGKRVGCDLEIYVDGQKDTVVISPNSNASAPGPTKIELGVPGTNNVTVGAWSGNARLFSYVGLMDDVVLYNRVLSAGEIASRAQ